MTPLIFYLVISGYKSSESEGAEKKTFQNAVVSEGSDTNLLGKNFINSIFNLPYSDENSKFWVSKYLSKQKNALHFNTSQVYDNINGDENGTVRYGQFGPSLSQEQKGNVQGLSDSITETNNLNAFVERSKISKLCYAQRLIYEAEGDSNLAYNYGFNYRTSRASIIQDSGRTVVYASSTGDSTPRYICEDIYENLQHGDLPYFNLQYSDNGLWYLKPMMRIDSNIVDSEPEKSVVRIDIINYSGNTIKQIELKAKNFKDENENYNGQYLDVYSGLATDSLLEILGRNDSINGLSYGIDYDNWESWDTACHIDFKVWWYGKVNVWFDKMTVDDSWSNILFDPSSFNNFDARIEDEISAYQQYGWDFVYYIDEIVASNVPCIKYVKQKINNRVKFSCAVNNWLNVHGMKNDALGHKFFMEQIEPEIFSCDAHVKGGYLNYFNNHKLLQYY
ncbi:MAG: hypothetical protein IPM38_03200 [Ignavibacteria bacterium]|nr:hypothetical protein [Ignavibacteria bacterium]